MEVSKQLKTFTMLIKSSGMLVTALLWGLMIFAQPPVKKYSVSKGEMLITLSKSLPNAELDEFIRQYDLSNLALKEMLTSSFSDSIYTHGWKLVINNRDIIVLSKPMFAADDINDPAVRIKMADLSALGNDLLNLTPASREIVGVNDFKKGRSFTMKDSMVHFLCRYYKDAKEVLLAGSFTSWQYGAVPMTKTDSGWLAQVKLAAGKYQYKFIADGDWSTDPDNKQDENDGRGNVNSVLFVYNHTFRLDTFARAKRVYVAGSFNNWQDGKFKMSKTEKGWELPVYLAEGTYTYRYIVDDNWMPDPGNKDVFPNEFNDYNSVVRIGTPYLFQLSGFQHATTVFLTGSFNQWRNFELKMSRTKDGWELPYTLRAGNYEFKFLADGHWLNAKGDTIKANTAGSTFVIEPNYTFRLKNYGSAKQVFVAGSFNNWSPNGFPMEKEGEDWVLPMHIDRGKHLYKFVVDDKWILDPANTLWEQNEFETGNSILWIE